MQTDTTRPDAGSFVDGDRPDEYRVRVFPSRRWGLVGPWGWRVQIDYLTSWDDDGDQQLLSGAGLWYWDREEAQDAGVEMALDIHERDAPELPPGPLMIWLGPYLVEDERTPREPESLPAHCPCCGHAQCIRTDVRYGDDCSHDGDCPRVLTHVACDEQACIHELRDHLRKHVSRWWRA